MKIILDCGSTKCAGVILSKSGDYISNFRLVGYNPLLHRNISDSTYQNFLAIKSHESHPEEITFCGAGCINEGVKTEVKKGFTRIFPKANIEIYSDLEFIGNILNITESSIICILGTGSNTGLWDGNKIVKKIISGGYLLGDEGSGYVLGKNLLINYLRQNFSPDSQLILNESIRKSYNEIMSELSNSDSPNRYVADFAKYFQSIDDPLKDIILNNEFSEFIAKRIVPIIQDSKLIHIFGSVSYFNIEYIKPLLEKVNLEIGIVAREPLDPIIHSAAKT